MGLQFNFVTWLIALVPVLTLATLMLGLHWGAMSASAVGLSITVLTALTVFDAPLRTILWEAAKGAWMSVTVILVIVSAVIFHEVYRESRAMESFKRGVLQLSGNELLQILGIGVAFVGFMQGITGFGVPVAVGAPLLASIGVVPVWAVAISLIGQAWGNTFGTLAVAWDALVLQGELPDTVTHLTALYASGLLWLLNLAGILCICWAYGGKQALRKGLPVALILSILQGGGELILSRWNTSVAALIPSAAALVGVFFMGRLAPYRREWLVRTSPIMDRTRARCSRERPHEEMSLVEAAMPCAFLLVVAVAVLLAKPVNRILSSWVLAPSFPATVTGLGVANPAVSGYAPLTPLTHAGTFLFLSSAIGYAAYRVGGYLPPAAAGRLIRDSAMKSTKPGVAVVLLLVMAKLMGGTGQTQVLAMGAAKIGGYTYGLLTPIVGLLGTFITGSNMSSNILFCQLHKISAVSLGASLPIILGAQTVGGAAGSMIAPSKVLLGTTTLGIGGDEGRVIRLTLPLAVGVSLVAGIVATLVSYGGVPL